MSLSLMLWLKGLKTIELQGICDIDHRIFIGEKVF